MTALSEAALEYARKGIAVFPLRLRSKEPRTLHGYKDASADLDLVEAWWNYGEADWNIGLATGLTFDVLDVDYLDPDIDRFQGPISATGRGYHLFYEPTGLGCSTNLKNTKDRHLDWRGSGGYIVAPPSVHPDGHLYEWLQPLTHPYPATNAYLKSLIAPALSKSPQSDTNHNYEVRSPLTIFEALAKIDPNIRFKNQGRTIKAACPFPDHRDSDPSLKVNPYTQEFKCWGCGRWGDADNIERYLSTGELH